MTIVAALRCAAPGCRRRLEHRLDRPRRRLACLALPGLGLGRPAGRKQAEPGVQRGLGPGLVAVLDAHRHQTLLPQPPRELGHVGRRAPGDRRRVEHDRRMAEEVRRAGDRILEHGEEPLVLRLDQAQRDQRLEVTANLEQFAITGLDRLTRGRSRRLLGSVHTLGRSLRSNEDRCRITSLNSSGRSRPSSRVVTKKISTARPRGSGGRVPASSHKIWSTAPASHTVCGECPAPLGLRSNQR